MVVARFKNDHLLNDLSATSAQRQCVTGLVTGCGAANRTRIELKTACKLTNGVVSLSLEGAAGMYRLWAPGNTNVPFLVSGGTTNWQNSAIAALPTNRVLYVEALSNGPFSVSYSYSDNPADPPSGETWYKSVLPGKAMTLLVPDFNHDRVIDGKDRSLISTNGPFRFWINDDADVGDVAEGDSDLPGQVGAAANYANNHVDGRCDLPDFFPVFLDLKDLMDVYSPADYSYVLLSKMGYLKFIDTDLVPANAGAYLTDTTLAESLSNATVQCVTGDFMTQLSSSFLGKIRYQGKGVILVEGSSVYNESLSVQVMRNGSVIFSSPPLRINLSKVTDMYRWINLRHVTGGSEIRATDLSEPSNNPDNMSNGKNFVFVHGYNNTEAEGGAACAEVFKRMYWSGSRAKFTGATWQADETPGILPAKVYFYKDVINAFDAASNFTVAVTGLAGDKWIAAHSLGNMLVSSAIVDYGLNPQQYFMIDAAVAMQAYKATEAHFDEMVPTTWGAYSNRLWASEWHKLFEETDGRHQLTWHGRFGNIPQAVNYYSSGEDVLNNNDPPEVLDFPALEKAWVFQECAKGGVYPAILVGVSSQGGWGFNSSQNGGYGTNEWLGYPYGYVWRQLNPGEASVTRVTDDNIRTNSFFKRFDNPSLYTPTGSALATNSAVRAVLLSEAIPSTSRATGRNQIEGYFQGNNVDLMSKKVVWPAERPLDGNGQGRWLHGDFRDVAFPYLHEFYEDMVNKGGLQ